MRAFFISLLLLFAVLPRGYAQDAGPCRLEDQQCQELMTYRDSVPKLVEENEQLRQLQQQKAAPAPQGGVTNQAYAAYLEKFYAQASQYRDVRISMYRWQEKVATWVFVIVLILTLCGIALAFYQLLSALRMGNAIKDAQLEISATKLVVTTSSIGVIVLFLSLAFFFIFAKTIYPVLPASAIN